MGGAIQKCIMANRRVTGMVRRDYVLSTFHHGVRASFFSHLLFFVHCTNG
jgi:hypothetical protein